MSATTPTPKNATSSFSPGCTTTISPVPMVASVTLHPSAALLRKVQPLEGSQLAHLCTTTKWAASPFGGFSKGEHHGRWHQAIFLTFISAR
jgi:hypothetical protein